MADVESSVVINRPPEEVFDHWADGRLTNRWRASSPDEGFQLVTPEPVGVGSRFEGTHKGIGDMAYQIVEYDRPHRFTMIVYTKIGELHHTVTCEPVAGGTHLFQQANGHLKGVFRLLAPVIRIGFGKLFQQNDRVLRRYLEEGAGAR